MRAKFLNENPNVIMDPDVWQRKKDNPNYTPKESETVPHDLIGINPITFGYYGKGQDRALFVSKGQRTHMDLWRRAGRLLGDAGTNPTVQQITNLIGTERGDVTGRLFPTKKVITFWTFPKDHNDLEKTIDDLNSEIKQFQIDDTWLVEIPAGEFKKHAESGKGGWGSWYLRAGHQEYIPISDYKGGHKRSKEEMAIQHVETPMNKKKREVPQGVGSKRYGERKPLAWRQAELTSESFYPRLK